MRSDKRNTAFYISLSGVLLLAFSVHRLVSGTNEAHSPGKEQPHHSRILEYLPGERKSPRMAGEFRIADVSVIDISTKKKIHLEYVDLQPTLDRIAAGEKDAHRNDGSVFRNASRLLPQRPQGYYREYVIRTPGIAGPGPQRLILGKEGEIYYTPDHYETFVAVKEGT